MNTDISNIKMSFGIFFVHCYLQHVALRLVMF